MSFDASGTLQRSLDLSTPKDTMSAANFSTVPLSYDFEDGVGSGQIDAWWHDRRSILPTANDDLDLAGGTVSAFGDLKLDFAKVKFVIISINSPDGTKSLRVGPQAVANAFQGPWGGTGATVYTTVTHSAVPIFEPYAGYTVTSGSTDILRINNPGAGTVTYDIWIGGVKP